MTETTSEPPKRKWIGLVVATLLGIVATIGVGWYQLSRAEKQAALAEEERTRGVRQSLVSIVEEHVLNEKPIELSRLARLIDQRRREEHVAGIITLSELLEQSEFNILNSRYLAFERKQTLKGVFEALYSELGTRAFAPYSPETVNADLLNQLARQIQEGKSADALESLRHLQEAHAKDIEMSGGRRGTSSFKELLDQMAKEPFVYIVMILAYILVLSVLLRRRSAFRRALRLLLGNPSGEIKRATKRAEDREESTNERP